MKQSNGNSALQLFEYEGQLVRSTVIDGEVWFVAKDVCDILGIQNHRDAISELDEDEVLRGVGISDSSKLRSEGSVPTLVSEPGLYALVFKSRKPEAKAFARWVRHDLLPQVMHTGSYSAKKKLPANSFKAAEALIDKVFKCRTEADCQQVRTLDKVFQGVYGYSVLEVGEIQPEAKPDPEPRNRSAEIWEHIVSTFAPDEWFTASELKQSLDELPVCSRQVRRYLLSFVANKQLKRRGSCKGTEYSITHYPRS